jgi:hypothetical protein
MQLARGYPDEAQNRIGKGIASATALNSPFELAYTQYLAAMLYLHLRDFEKAKIAGSLSVALSREHGFMYYIAGAGLCVALAEAMSGGSADALNDAHSALRILDESHARSGTTIFLSWLAEAQARYENPVDALRSAEKALRLNPIEPIWRISALRGDANSATSNRCRGSGLPRSTLSRSELRRKSMGVARGGKS